MYQVTFSFADGDGFRADLDELRKRIRESETPQATTLFHIFNASPDKDVNLEIAAIINDYFPGAPYLGCSSNANIVDGELVSDGNTISIICDVYEDPGTNIEVMQLPLSYESQDETAQALLDRLAERGDVKAVEIMNTVETANMPRFCGRISEADERIVMFGGGALNWETNFFDVVVFSSAGQPTSNGIVFVLYAGENFHAQTQLVQGWKPLGMPFRITRAERMMLYELNDRPALEIYNHYLQFSENDSFLENGLCFPISIECEGVQVLRTPIAEGPDDSIIMPTDMSDVQGDCRIAYGDPLAIREDIAECAEKIRAFGPQAMMVFACVARLLYWGNDYAPLELRQFRSLGAISGFYTGNELIRQGRAVMHHNLALVLVGLREGEPEVIAEPKQGAAPEPIALNLQLSIIGHMASFIGAAAEELQEAYDQLDAIARTDGLTGVANRREVERAVRAAVQRRTDTTSKPHAVSAGGADAAPVGGVGVPSASIAESAATAIASLAESAATAIANGPDAAEASEGAVGGSISTVAAATGDPASAAASLAESATTAIASGPDSAEAIEGVIGSFVSNIAAAVGDAASAAASLAESVATAIANGPDTAEASEGASIPSLIMLDLDDFKQVNDTYGHEEGDEVLRRVADLVGSKATSFDSDAVTGRWGGEEFMVLLPSATLEEAARLAEEMRQDFAAIHFDESGNQTMSLGVARMRHGETADALCSRVDHALYRAKEQGKNQVVTD